MKYQNVFLVVALALILAACSKNEGKKEADEKGAEKTAEKGSEKGAEKAPAAESRVKHGTNDEVIVTVETNLQQTIGLQASALEAAQTSPEIKAYGRVMDP